MCYTSRLSPTTPHRSAVTPRVITRLSLPTGSMSAYKPTRSFRACSRPPTSVHGTPVISGRLLSSYGRSSRQSRRDCGAISTRTVRTRRSAANAKRSRPDTNSTSCGVPTVGGSPSSASSSAADTGIGGSSSSQTSHSTRL